MDLCIIYVEQLLFPNLNILLSDILIGIFGSLSWRTIILLFDNLVILCVWLHQRDSCISEPSVFCACLQHLLSLTLQYLRKINQLQIPNLIQLPIKNWTSFVIRYLCYVTPRWRETHLIAAVWWSAIYLGPLASSPQEWFDELLLLKLKH